MYSRVPDGEEIIMSIANGTIHYGYPQVQLTDKPTFADFNPAFADIDSKLYGLITGAATDEQAIADLGTTVGNLTTELGSVSETATAAKDKADASEEAITLLSGQVSQNTTRIGSKIDSNAIAEPYDTTATYEVDDVVTYQGQRYRCTTAVLVAEPFDATKWIGEDVETVLDHLQDEIDNIPVGGGTAADTTLAPISGMTATNVQDGIAELHTGLAKEYEKDATGVSTFAVRSNNTVILEIVLAAANITGSSTILTLDSDVRPAANKSVTGIVEIVSGSVGSVQAANFTISTSGAVQCTGNITNGYGQIIAVYKTA